MTMPDAFAQDRHGLVPEASLTMSDAHIQEVAERAVTRALNDAFRLVGIDLGTMEDINQFRDDVRFIRRQRSALETQRTEVMKSVVAAVVGGVIGMLLSAVTWLLTALRHTS